MEIETILKKVSIWVVETIASGSVNSQSAVMCGFDTFTACIDRAASTPIDGCIAVKVVSTDAGQEEVSLYFMPNGFYIGSSKDKFVFMDYYTEDTLVANLRKYYKYYECARGADGSVDTTFSEGNGIFEGQWLPDITISLVDGKVVKLA